jgi:SPP1 gp7 family putative phage head morphogenesis protein
MAKEEKELDDDTKQEVLRGILLGGITLTALPSSVFEPTNQFLFEMFEEGFEGSTRTEMEGSSRWLKAKDIEQNIRVFSAAKTFQQVKKMSDYVLDENGKKRPFPEFEKRAGQVFDLYNREWLRTEQDTAFNVSQQAKHWDRIEQNADLFPILRYQTQGDDQVRDAHERLEGVTRRVNDPFWDTYFPPNGWRCRCPKPKQMRSGIESRDEDIRNVPKPDKLFDFNPGKHGMIFREDIGDGLEHPYFRVNERYEPLKEDGFGLA